MGTDGCIYAIPCDVPHVLRIDPFHRTVSLLGDSLGAETGLPLRPDGRQRLGRDDQQVLFAARLGYLDRENCSVVAGPLGRA